MGGDDAVDVAERVGERSASPGGPRNSTSSRHSPLSGELRPKACGPARARPPQHLERPEGGITTSRRARSVTSAWVDGMRITSRSVPGLFGAQRDPEQNGQGPLAAADDPPQLGGRVAWEEHRVHVGAVGEAGLDVDGEVTHPPQPDGVHAAAVGGDHAADGGAVACRAVDAHRENRARRRPRGSRSGWCRRWSGWCPRADSATPSSRLVLSTSSWLRGTPPPTSPVLPPWTTTGMPASWHAAITAQRPATGPGLTTAGVEPVNSPVQSVTYPATRSGSVSTCSSPTIRPGSAAWRNCTERCTLPIRRFPRPSRCRPWRRCGRTARWRRRPRGGPRSSGRC